MSQSEEFPLVSVLTPSFNQARWLQDAICSVASQTYPHIEHIIMDGGSSDETLEILCHAPPHVRYRSEPDGGQAHAVNKALALSRGAIIGWLNSDDAYYSRTAVQRAVELFKRHPDVVAVYGHAALVDADGLVLHMMWVPPFSRRLLKIHNFIIQPAAFVRRAAVAPILLDQTYDYAMDRELWLRLSARGRIARVDCVFAIDRHHAERKVERLAALGARENERLRQAYGLPPQKTRARAVRPIKVAARISGLRLMTKAREEHAAHLRVDSMSKLVIRQTLRRRRAMSPT